MSLEKPFEIPLSEAERDAIRLWASETGHMLSEWANYASVSFLPYLNRVLAEQKEPITPITPTWQKVILPLGVLAGLAAIIIKRR